MAKDIDQQIQEAEAHLKKLQDERNRQLAMTDDQRLAEWMHDTYCNSSHEDQCGWHYERTDLKRWSGNAHRRHLDKAVDILNTGVSMDMAKKVIRAYVGY